MAMRTLCGAVFLSALMITTAAGADDAALAAVSHDGLALRPGKVAKVLYVRPGVDFSRYKRIAILDCAVAFRKDWDRDKRSSGNRVTQKDMDWIKSDLSAEFLKVFNKVQKFTRYQGPRCLYPPARFAPLVARVVGPSPAHARA